MTPSKEFLEKLAKLEAVERRWLVGVLSAILLSSIALTLILTHLDISSMIRNEPVRIPPTQLLILVGAVAIILLANLGVVIEYFAFELRIERAIVIKKRKRRDWAEMDEYEQDRKEPHTQRRT